MGMENYIYIMAGKNKIESAALCDLIIELVNAGIVEEVNDLTRPFFSIFQGKEKATFSFEFKVTEDFFNKIKKAIEKDDPGKEKESYFQWFHFYFTNDTIHLTQYKGKEEFSKTADSGFSIQISIKRLWANPVNVITLVNETVVPIFEKALGVKAQVEYHISY